MAALIEFQHVFDQALKSSVNTNVSVDANANASVNANANANVNDKIDFSVSQGLKTLKSRIHMQEVEKANKAIKANKVYKKRTDANTSFADIQEDATVMGDRNKLIHKKWTSLDRCLQWQLIQVFVESQPSDKYNLEALHILLKQNALPADSIIYDNKKACITEIRLP